MRRILVVVVKARHQRHTGLAHDAFGGRFGSHGRDRRGRRPYEHQPGSRTCGRKRRVFGQESVPWMNRLRSRALRDRDDHVAVEITLPRRRRAQAKRFVAGRDMHCIGVGIRKNGDGPDAHAPRGARDPAGNLAAIGDQDFVKHRVSPTARHRLPMPPARPACERLQTGERCEPRSATASVPARGSTPR